jgi:hypothetical protein
MKRAREPYPLRSRKPCELDRLHDDIFFYMEREKLIEPIDLLMLAHAYRPARVAVPSLLRGADSLFMCAYAACDNDKQLEYICRGLTTDEKKERHFDAWIGMSLSKCDFTYHIDHMIYSKRPWRLSPMSIPESLALLITCAQTGNTLFIDAVYNYGPKSMEQLVTFLNVRFLREAIRHLEIDYIYSLIDDVIRDYYDGTQMEFDETMWTEVIRNKEWDVYYLMLHIDHDPWNVNILGELFHANSKGAMRVIVDDGWLDMIDHALIQEGLDHDCLKSIKVLLDHGIEIAHDNYADDHVSDEMRALLKW